MTHPRDDGRGLVAVFGGGGVKAAAHAGAWRALTEAKLAPSHYCGTSMGAVVAACFSAGLSFEDVRRRMTGLKRENVARRRSLLAVRGLTAPSVFYLEPLRHVIEQLVPVRSFAELSVPLTVTAVDIESGALALFGAGGTEVPLVEALLASCALPVFYPSVEIQGRRYADGGLRSVLPLDVVGNLPASMVVAVDTGPGFDEKASASGMPALLDAHNAATGILMASNTAAEVAQWRLTPGRAPLVYVRPKVDKNVTFRVDLAEKYAEEGYRATKAELARLGLGG
ncbi:MAG: patatin-like phospholipase family protein [Gemmatimonadota bacterium]